MKSQNGCWRLVGVVLVCALSASLVRAQTLSYSGTPALGQTVTFTTRGTPGASYLLAVSTVPGPSPLPPLGNLAIGQPFFFLVGPSALFPFVPALGANGQASVVVQIPLNLAFYGLTFYFQAAYADPAAPLLISLTNGVSFTIGSPLTAPVIAAIVPATGGASGGTAVTVTGDHFLPGPTTATLGGQPLVNLQVVDTQTITGQTPPGTPGTSADLVITAAGGSAGLTGAFSYLPELPAILSIVPDHVPVGGGSLITINGTGLGPGTTVYLAGLPLQPMTQNAGQIVAFAPLITTVGYVDAAVVSPLGISFHYDVFRYTIILDTGTGADGAFAPSANTTLSTANNFGVWNFTGVNIAAGVTVAVTGSNPLTIKCTGNVRIAGTLNLSGLDGPQTGSGPGGFPGGIQGPGSGPGGGGLPGTCALSGSYGTSQFLSFQGGPAGCTGGSWFLYGNAVIQPLLGGSGGASAGTVGGGGGGGAAAIVSAGEVLIDGVIVARGGNGVIPPYPQSCSGAGSGGAIKIQSQGHITVTGTASVAGGQTQNGCGSSGQQLNVAGNGRWYVQNWLGQAAYDTTPSVPPGIY